MDLPRARRSGSRLIDEIDVTHVDLVETTRFVSGIVVNAYAPKS